MRTRPRIDIAAGTAAVALAVLAAALGCSDATEVADPRGEIRPAAVGETEYARRLRSESGSPLSPRRLAQLAAEAEARIEDRLELLADSIEPDTDWRRLFALLRRDHPADAEATLAAYRSELEMAAAFVARQEFVSLPPSPPRVVEARNQLARENFPFALYTRGSLAITVSPGPEPDPEYLANHCRVCIAPLAVHEGYPGHHVAFYHASIAREGLELGREVEIRTRPPIPYFHEGWGLYSELLMLVQGYYEGAPERELGAWRYLLLRALRARVDTALHGGALDPEAAAALYRERLLMDADAARAEVRRHLSKPTNKASYFVGLLQILELRRRVLGTEPETSLREFHDRLLRRPASLPAVAQEEFGVDLGSIEDIDVEALFGEAG